jgi:hypothetical protein
MFLAEAEHRLATLNAGGRLQGARPVVETGMDHPTVVPTLVSREAILCLKDNQ